MSTPESSQSDARSYEHNRVILGSQKYYDRYGTPRERLYKKFKIDADSGCWVWTGAKTPTGYGVMVDSSASGSRRHLLAHRVSYELHTGSIPAGYVIDHLCRNHGCVNPKHLEAVTHAENVRRGTAGLFHKSKTHCKQGHPFDDKNTMKRNGGKHRKCLQCNRDITLRSRLKAKLKRIQPGTQLSLAIDAPTRRPR